MTITLMICGTVLLCLCITLKWITDMSTADLPMFTHGECVWKDSTEESTVEPVNPVGFANTEEPSEKKSDKELKEAFMKDPITMAAALLRGEVDIDDVTI
jgi:hypothetical protein